ncbi:MAG: polysaccharide biosynthesis C-terminal domain-containing protein [Bacilli bacterium]|nr:polysaccharide biosynthesis C-terminal domain-containing protein [Bacilli bacterium]
MRSKKALKNIIYTLIQQTVTIVCGLIVPRLIISKFGSSVNGLISSITQFLAYIVLLDSGFSPVIKSLLYKPIAKKNKQEIENILYATERFFKIIARIFIVYIIILIFIYPTLVSTNFNHIFTITLLIIISISTFAEYYFGMTYKIYLQAEQKLYIVSLLQILTTVLNTIFVVVLIRLNANILIVKLVSSLIFVIRPILQNVYVKKKYNINLRKANKNYKIEKKWDGLAQHIAAVIHGNTDVTILTIFTNVLEVSVYSVHYLVINGIKKLIQAISNGVDASFGNMIAKDEKEHLNNSFSVYEFLYYTLITIIYICTISLLSSFVCIYTRNVKDVNYYRPVFAILMSFAEYIHAIRLPYSTITLAAGKFKETRNGAILEAIINLVISIILVFKFGLIGVTIGTIVAMIIRTIEFMIYTSKKVLYRKSSIAFKKAIFSIIEMVLCCGIIYYMNIVKATNYVEWVIDALKVFTMSSVIVMIANVLIYNKDFKNTLNILKNMKKKNGRIQE